MPEPRPLNESNISGVGVEGVDSLLGGAEAVA